MNRIMMIIGMLAMTLLLTACGGGQKNALDYGHALVKTGKCAEAQPYLNDAVAQPEDIMQLAYAYYMKGVCAERSGNVAEAYEYYYAAKIVTCYAVENDTTVNMNTYGRSEYCERILPEKLAKLAPEVGSDAEVERIVSKVNSSLDMRYLQRFNKRLK